MLYNHKNLNNNSNTNTYTNTGGLCRFTHEQVNEFLALIHGDTKIVTQFLKTNANHAMLTPPHSRRASCGV